MIQVRKKYYNVLFSFIMAVIMTSVMSLIITIASLGFVENLHIIWMNNWLTAFFIAYPLLLVIVPNVKRLMEKLFYFS